MTLFHAMMGHAASTPLQPMTSQPMPPPLSNPRDRFSVDIRTVHLRHAGSCRIAKPVAATPGHPERAHRRLPILSARHVSPIGASEPAADFAFFREPLKRNPALIGKWGAAAQAGSQSEAWSQFLADVSARFFKGSRKQRVMDALVLSLDILPANRRADALACLLEDGSEGLAAAEEFWKYVGMERIPDADKPRVAELILKHEIGL
ncbi:hypothetical protein LXM60_20045 [Pandoraea sputorum]|uniref:hypothetical protein n=1 Tax=Pandoraea sputorum TaxID=93222 RepID=UPI001E5FC242|nr:hypothetical protein [Pandoraea sputorum]MCE4062497.1 hypothetical protein [Pandoraea sputorum]